MRATSRWSERFTESTFQVELQTEWSWMAIFYSFLYAYVSSAVVLKQNPASNDRLCLDRIQPRVKRVVATSVTCLVNTSVDFLDITITNENSQLRTTIYHKPAAEPYILPYTSDHPRHVHHNIPCAALLRAARICSNVHDFNSECIRINISLLLSPPPPQKSQFSSKNSKLR